MPSDGEAYRFEIGGGHWIFDADKEVLDFIHLLAATKNYTRRASIYLPDMNLFVPYPIQNHLFCLPSDIKEKALKEILSGKEGVVSTFSNWLEMQFGRTLCDLFFFPFHELYTAGLYTKIAPQDSFKSPVDRNLIVRGTREKTPEVGYNVTFAYPQDGFDDVVKKISQKCRINYNKILMKINLEDRELLFQNGCAVKYESIISTLPLDAILKMSGLDRICNRAPYTSVLVFNIAAKKGNKCPSDHWVYIPKSKAGFYRIGFYSNVDDSFLPVSLRKNSDRVSIYVEKAYLGGNKPSSADMKRLSAEICGELKEWGFISEVEIISPSWVQYGYTWQYPDSRWADESIKLLYKHRIYQIGRYGKWKFQGIAASIKDGLGCKQIQKGQYL